MKIPIRKTYAISLVVFIILMCYLFWGPLFPWSPVKIGYTKIISPKATVYIKNMEEKDKAVTNIASIISQIEELHDISYTTHFKIIVLDEESNMKRYLPWLKGSGYSVSLSFFNVIYIGPAARKSRSGIESYIKHELSHLLIGQNTSQENALKIYKQGWLSEGLAEYFSGHSFYSLSELKKLYGSNFGSDINLQENNPHNMSFKELKLKYSYFKYFIEFLIRNHGLDKLQEYLKIYLNNPDNYKSMFNAVYDEKLERIIYKFNMYVTDQNYKRIK